MDKLWKIFVTCSYAKAASITGLDSYRGHGFAIHPKMRLLYTAYCTKLFLACGRIDSGQHLQSLGKCEYHAVQPSSQSRPTPHEPNVGVLGIEDRAL